MRNALMTMLALALGAGTAHAASGGVPLAISHTGYFLDGNDLPVNSAGLALKFEIYDVDLPIGAQQLQWEATCTVTLTHGYYTVVLGEAPCAGTSQLDSADIPPSQSRWLQVSVGSIALMPRLQLTTVPTAAVAALALDSQKLGGIAASALVNGTGKVLASALPTGAGGVPLLDAGGQLAAGVLPAISDAQVAAGAAISASKIAGLGALAGKSSIGDADVAAGAGIAVSKFAAGTNGQILTTSGGAPTWSTVAGTLGYTPVNAAGDTMTGGLNLPVNGLVIGTNQLVVSGGNVGIGTATPNAALQVASGQIVGKTGSSSTSTIDFSTGNLQYTANSCGALALWNMKDGGTYSLAVKGATSATCSFTAYSDTGSSALTVHPPPDNGATTANKHTIFTFLVLGSDVYASWVTGL